MYSVVKLNKNRHHKCLHFDDLEEAVLEFNHLTIKNKGNKNTIVCLATFADKLTKVKKKANKKQKKKRQDDTHMLYRVYFPSLPGMIKLVFPNIPDMKEPALYCTLLNNLDKAVCFFDKITDKYKNIPDSLICLCNAFDEDYSLFKFDGSDVPIFEERDKGFYKIEKNNKNSNHTKRSKQCLNENKATVSHGDKVQIFKMQKKLNILTGSNPIYHNDTHKKVGRNDFCPCGSGLKYKKCCLNNNQS